MIAWVDPHHRYLIVVLPILFYYFFNGVQELATFASKLAERGIFGAPMSVLIVSAALALLFHRSGQSVILGRYSGRYLAFLVAAFIYFVFLVWTIFVRPERFTLAGVSGVFAVLLFTNSILTLDWMKRREPRTLYPEAVYEYYEASMRLRESERLEARGSSEEEGNLAVMCTQPFLTFLWSNQSTVHIPLRGGREVLRKVASEGVQILIVDRMHIKGPVKRYLEPVVEEHPELFLEEFSVGETRVYQVRTELLREKLDNPERRSRERPLISPGPV